jgi:hypothetical protein
MAAKNTTENTSSKVEQWDVVAPATVEVQVGAGRARVDIAPGDPLPDTLTDEDRNALIQRGAIRKRADESDVESDVGSVQALDGAAVVRPVPGVVEPDEIPRDLIPGGSVKDIMTWVGEDLARARVARDAETAKGPSARASLLRQLDDVKADVDEDPEPLGTPEAIDPNIPGGRVDAAAVVAQPEPAGDGKADAKAETKGDAKSSTKSATK